MTDMSPKAVSARLRRVSELSDLTTGRRLAAKVDMSPGAVTRRLRTASQMRDVCLSLARHREPSSSASDG